MLHNPYSNLILWYSKSCLKKKKGNKSRHLMCAVEIVRKKFIYHECCDWYPVHICTVLNSTTNAFWHRRRTLLFVFTNNPCLFWHENPDANLSAEWKCCTFDVIPGTTMSGRAAGAMFSADTWYLYRGMTTITVLQRRPGFVFWLKYFRPKTRNCVTFTGKRRM